MTPELQAEVIELGNRLFPNPKGYYNSTEQQVIYEIYNKINGTHDVPNGCPSCLRNHVNSVRNVWIGLVKTNPVQ